MRLPSRKQLGRLSAFRGLKFVEFLPHVRGERGYSQQYDAQQNEQPGKRSEGMADLLPIGRTSHISKKSITPENDGHENKQIQRRANHWIFKVSRGRYAD